MLFHVPVRVLMCEKNSRKSLCKRATIRLLLKDPVLKGPSLLIKSASKTIRLDVRSINGHSDPLNLAILGGGWYNFALLDAYDCTENRVMLVRLIEIVKLINKGKKFSTEDLHASMQADPLVIRYRKTWQQMTKELNIPQTEMFMSRVDLTGQKLKTLPPSLGNVLLKEVILDDNLLGESDHFWTWLKGPVRFSLRSLSVKNNKLKNFPSQIVMCHALDTVNFANNDLKVLPHKLFWPPVRLKKIDVSNNANLLFWPYPVLTLQEVNIEGCRSLLSGRVQCKHEQMRSPPTLADLTATIILNVKTTSLGFPIETLPNTLMDKLNRAVLCYKCSKFYTKPVSHAKFAIEIAAGTHKGLPQTPVTTLKFDCGCNIRTAIQLHHFMIRAGQNPLWH